MEDVAEHSALARALAEGDSQSARESLVHHIAAVARRIGLADRPSLPGPASQAAHDG
jgi:DNA-binding GntR family transcriptional regulator